MRFRRRKINKKNKKKKEAVIDFLFQNKAGRIRTCGMTESESVALPLGDSPILNC